MLLPEREFWHNLIVWLGPQLARSLLLMIGYFYLIQFPPGTFLITHDHAQNTQKPTRSGTLLLLGSGMRRIPVGALLAWR